MMSSLNGKFWSGRAVRRLAACGLATAAISAGGAGMATASPATPAARAAGELSAYPSVAAAVSARYCGASHVTVVVDFTHFRNGRVWIGCASSPHTGLAALRQAGFTYSFVARHPGFVCTINHRPNPCNGAPATAYWSYYHARHHGSWRYSTTGAGSYHPRPGQIEGWAFGAGHKPRISPP
ncbi:MAG TPA: hypothetical protein VF843_16435 [Streptosporangiaceae bacterium]